MSVLDHALATIRGRIGQHQGRGISEEATKAALVNPMLRALDWDTEDLHQVYPEYSSAGDRVDYALLIEGEVRLLIEAKALDSNLDDPRWAKQLTGYAVTTGVRWAVLTNGDEYRVYNAYGEVALPQKLFRTVRLSGQDLRAAETLGLLSRGAVRGNRLDACWQEELENRRLERVNQQLQSTLQALVDQDPPNELLVQLLQNQPGCQLAPGDIRAGLRRTRVRFEHSAMPETASDPLTPPIDPISPPIPEPRRRVRLKSLFAKGIIQPPLDIHVEVQGHRHSAAIDADGNVIFQGQRLSAVHATQAARRVAAAASPTSISLPATFWEFWRFIDADGQVKPLGVLRQRFLQGSAAEGQPPRRSLGPRGARVLLRHLIEAGVLSPPLEIHVLRRGQRHSARVEADGTIMFQGNRYATPSRAGIAVKLLHGSQAGVSGWNFWQFTDADGRSQPLSVLRDQYLEQRAPEQP